MPNEIPELPYNSILGQMFLSDPNRLWVAIQLLDQRVKTLEEALGFRAGDAD